MKRILIVGLPYFSQKICKQLNEKFSDEGVLFDNINTSSIVGKIQFISKILFSEKVYFIGGSFITSRVADISILLKKKVIFHWVGTDVTEAQAAFKKGFRTKYKDSVLHLCEIDWIRNELSEVEIKAEVVSLASIENVNFISKKKEFVVLAYIGKNREDFYGIKWIRDLSFEHPEIKIKIVGSDLNGYSLGSNCEVLGWVNDMDSLYRDCSLYVRIPKHDGLAFSVLESLAYGLNVIYTYNFPHCDYVNSYEGFKTHILAYRERFYENGFKPNVNGINFVRENFNPTLVLGKIFHFLIC